MWDRRHPCCYRRSVFLQCLISPVTADGDDEMLPVNYSLRLRTDTGKIAVLRSAPPLRTHLRYSRLVTTPQSWSVRLEELMCEIDRSFAGARKRSPRGAALGAAAAAHCIRPSSALTVSTTARCSLWAIRDSPRAGRAARTCPQLV